MRRYVDDYIAPVAHYFRPDASVLDVGCGHGYLTVDIASRCEKVVGVDLNQKRLKTAREFARSEKQPVEFVHADAMKLPFKDDSFDLVFSQWMLEWIYGDGQAEALAEMRRVVKPGGHVIVHVGWWPGITFEPDCPTLRSIHVECQHLHVPNLLDSCSLADRMCNAGLANVLIVENNSKVSHISPGSGDMYRDEIGRLRGLLVEDNPLTRELITRGGLSGIRAMGHHDLDRWIAAAGAVHKAYYIGVGVKE